MKVKTVRENRAAILRRKGLLHGVAGLSLRLKTRGRLLQQ
jgi:hypothetical protein